MKMKKLLLFLHVPWCWNFSAGRGECRGLKHELKVPSGRGSCKLKAYYDKKRIVPLHPVKMFTV